MDLGSAGQSILNARTNVLCADVSLEFGLLHKLGRLLACAAQE